MCVMTSLLGVRRIETMWTSVEEVVSHFLNTGYVETLKN